MELGQMQNLLGAKSETKAESLFWRPFKLYWKKLLSVSLIFLLPGGLWILVLFLIAYALNWWHKDVSLPAEAIQKAERGT